MVVGQALGEGGNWFSSGVVGWESLLLRALKLKQPLGQTFPSSSTIRARAPPATLHLPPPAAPLDSPPPIFTPLHLYGLHPNSFRVDFAGISHADLYTLHQIFACQCCSNCRVLRRRFQLSGGPWRVVEGRSMRRGQGRALSWAGKLWSGV